MPKNLLVADDSVTIQRVVGITFAAEDYAVTAVDNGDDCLARARAARPDVVLVDVVMPKRSGYDVCQALKADPATAGVPVILLAGTFEAFDEARARGAHADAWIQKPFESQALINKVRELVEGAPPQVAPGAIPLASRVTEPTPAPLSGPAAPAPSRPAAPAPAAAAAPRPAAPPAAARPAAATPPRPVAPSPGAMPPAGARPPAGVMPPGARPPTGAFPPPGARPPAGAMPPPGARPPPGAMPPPGARPPTGAFPPPGARPPAGAMPPPGARPPPGAMPPLGARPPSGAFPPPGARLPAGAMPPPGVRPPPGVAPPAARPPVHPAPPPPAPPAHAVPAAAPTGRRDPFGLEAPAAAPAPRTPAAADDDWSDLGMARSHPPAPPPGLELEPETSQAPGTVAPIEIPEAPLGEPILAPLHEFVPPAATTGHRPEPVAPPAAPPPAAPPLVAQGGSGPLLGQATPADGGEAVLREALSQASREVIERVVWEVVPQLAETIIRENLDRLTASRPS